MQEELIDENINNDNLALSVIAFLDKDAEYVADTYVFEFAKIVLYKNGFWGLDIEGIQREVEELVSIKYTIEEIKAAIQKCDPDQGVIECNINEEDDREYYSITSTAEKELRTRNKNFQLRKYIDAFCDSRFLNGVVILMGTRRKTS